MMDADANDREVMTVATQQVVAPPAKAGMFLVLTVNPGAEDAVRDLLPDVSGLTRSVSFRAPDDGLICVMDADGQHPPEKVREMLDVARDRIAGREQQR